MSFAARDLSVLAYANGFTLWHYTTIDDNAAVTGVGYYNAATEMLRVGDILIANVDTDGTLDTKLYTVTSNVSGVVSVGELLTT